MSEEFKSISTIFAKGDFSKLLKSTLSVFTWEVTFKNHTGLDMNC